MTSRSNPQPLAALGALAALALATGIAQAQPAVSVSAPTPATPPFRSALESYQPYTEEKTVNWREANDLTARIGGWRGYAREVQQTATPDAAAATPASDPHAGHSGHATPPKDKP